MKPTTARISQLIFLALFLVLFLMTEYRGSERIVAAVNGFFRANPLTAAITMLAAKQYLPLLLPGLLVLFLALFLGRFFCGWICPLGTILDLCTGKIRKRGPIRALQGSVKYWLLLPLLVASLFGLNLAGLLDPIALLLRALTFFFHPLFGETVRGGWKSLYGLAGDRRDLLDPAYHLLRDYILPFRETLYPLAFLSALLFFLIIYLERYEKRAWCRRLCPLGTLLGLVSRFGPLSRVPTRLCPDCQACREHCPTSFDQDLLQSEECILCMECTLKCPNKRVRFSFRNLRPERGPVLGRRVFLGGILSGFVLAKTFRFRDPAAQAQMLRPPGVRSEDEFLRSASAAANA